MPDQARQRSQQTASLYEEDHLAWIEAQAAHLRAGRTEALDVANLAEELDDMAASQRRELESRLQVLLMDLLKTRFQPKRRTRSWATTIVTQRLEIERLLRYSPSLRQELATSIAGAYRGAVKAAVAETGLPRSTFPNKLPFTADEVLGADDE